MVQGKKIFLCNNADLPCKYYVEKTEFSVREGEDERCPECKKADITFVMSAAKGLKKAGRISLFIAFLSLILVLIVWRLIPGQPASVPVPIPSHGIPIQPRPMDTNKDAAARTERKIPTDSTRPLNSRKQPGNNRRNLMPPPNAHDDPFHSPQTRAGTHDSSN